ncbi:tetratricopeptide repeat protein [Streptomyces sp. NBC_01296]|uniref:tetratricopeptide repeat protein n=1 Tax=Streptomyces sp. NBC_01296 TaxID=2903816 RepID=UPI002E13C760|nr:tetratricopeptide repeat protein [Streptomyces sp. NBC_01296]
MDGQAGQGPLAELKRRLRRGQETAGLSRGQLQARTNLSTTTLHNAINGPGEMPSAETLRLLAPQLNLDLDDLLDLRNRAFEQQDSRTVEQAEVTDDHRRAREDATSDRRQSVPFVGRVPDEVDGFQERAVIEELAAALAAERLVVIVGLGGVGKTQLAAAWAQRRVGARDVDLVVWVDASSRDAIVSRYAEAGARFAEADPGDPGKAAERFLAWLESTPRRWLVVLDNVERSNDLGELWPSRQNPAGRTIVTARPRHSGIVGRGHRVVEVDVFTEAEAEAYLRHGLREDLVDDVAGVVSDLGRLPLALGQAAAYLFNEDVACSEYRRRFADYRGQRLADLVPERDELPNGYPSSVAVTWLLSIEAADAGRCAGLVRPVLELASVLDSEGIPTSVLTTSVARAWLSHARSVDTGAPPQELDASTVYAALRRLYLYSLASVGHHEVRVHTLVQRAVRDELPPGRLRHLTWTAANALVTAWPEHGRDPDLNQRLRANTEALERYADEHLWSTDAYHPVLTEAGRSLGQVGQATPAAAYFNKLHATAAKRLGPDHPATLAARGDQVIWQLEAHDRTGLDNARQLVIDRSRVLGPAHPETHNARHTLGLALGHFGDPQAAVAELESLLADRTAILGPKHPVTLKLRHNLAMNRGEAGDAAGAVSEFKAILADTERVLGTNHPETLATRHELARWQLPAGDPARTATEFAQLLADWERELGPNHHRTLRTRSELAITTSLSDGDPAAAVTAFELLLDIRLHALGPDHPDTLETRLFLIICRLRAGSAANVVTDLEAVLDDILQAFGPHHPHAHQACSLLAHLRNDSASTSPDELLTASLRVLGPDHPEIWQVRAESVLARIEAGDAAGVVTALEGLVNDLTRLHGPDHPNSLRTRAKLAQSRVNADDPVGALTDYEALLADYLRLHGRDHADVLATLANIAAIRDAAGDHINAAAAYEELLAACLRILSPDHPDTLGTRNNIARMRGDAGDAAGAATAFEELHADSVRILDPDHPLLAVIRENLAYFRSLADDPADEPSRSTPRGEVPD